MEISSFKLTGINQVKSNSQANPKIAAILSFDNPPSKKESITGNTFMIASSQKPQANTNLSFVDRREPLEDTFTSQFEEYYNYTLGKDIPGLSGRAIKLEAWANCGPASASMILKRYGIEPPDMHTIRKIAGARLAVTGDESGAFAIGKNQLINAVKKIAGKDGLEVNGDFEDLPNNAKEATSRMKNKLEQGDEVIFLSGMGGAIGGLNPSGGHYVIVKEVNPDGSIIIDNPGTLKDGENQLWSAAQVQEAMDHRRAKGKGSSSMLSFRLVN